MAFGLLNEYRIHTTKVESKIQEAQAFLYNSEAFLRNLAEHPDAITGKDINALQTMLAHIARTLNEVNQ